jgi:1,2-phenylacetyl-CoA epoxidase catalytic subunit
VNDVLLLTTRKFYAKFYLQETKHCLWQDTGARNWLIKPVIEIKGENLRFTCYFRVLDILQRGLSKIKPYLTTKNENIHERHPGCDDSHGGN